MDYITTIIIYIFKIFLGSYRWLKTTIFEGISFSDEKYLDVWKYFFVPYKFVGNIIFTEYFVTYYFYFKDVWSKLFPKKSYYFNEKTKGKKWNEGSK